MGFSVKVLNLFAVLLVWGNPAVFPASMTGGVVQAQTVEERKAESDRLLQQGIEQFQVRNFREALQSWDEALAIYREIGDRQGEFTALSYLGSAYASLGQYEQAIEFFQQSLRLAREMGDRQKEATVLNNLGLVYQNLGEYQQALDYYQQALPLTEAVGDHASESISLDNLGSVYQALGRYTEAEEFYRESLEIRKELLGNEHPKIALSLDNVANVYQVQGRYEEAEELYRQSLEIRRRLLGDEHTQIALSLDNLANVYQAQGQYQQAIDLYQQALSTRRHVGDRQGEAESLGNLADAYQSLAQNRLSYITYRQPEANALAIEQNLELAQEQYEQAIEFYNQQLALIRAIGDRSGEANSLSSLGFTYYSLGQYQQALNYYEQSIAIARETGDRLSQAKIWSDLGLVYDALGQYNDAISFYRKAVELSTEMGDRLTQANALGNIGIAYNALGEHQKAIDFHQKSLNIDRDISNEQGAVNSIGNLGFSYQAIGQHNQAIQYSNRAIEMARNLGMRFSEANFLDNLGNSYRALGQYQKALEFYQQAYAIFQGLGVRRETSIVLSNIGTLLAEKENEQAAIALLKQSVHITESIRQNLRNLDPELQKSYTSTVADTYRYLADLLLQQNRLLEAQQILDLLKRKELREYTRDTRIGGGVAQVTFNSTETEILDEHGTLIAFGQTVLECEQKDCDNLSQMRDRLDHLSTQFNQNITQIESEIAARRLQDRGFLDPEDLGRAAQEIVEAEPGTIVIYPFVLPDKIWLLWAAPGGVFNTIEVPVSETELAATVLKFRQSLQDPYSNLAQLQQTSQKLYNWLIKPLAAELEANEIQHLVFSLDRATRYIPLSALFDGDRYLVERYQISTILSADLTDVRDRLPPAQETNILAMGLSEAVAGFNPLPNVITEIDAVVRTDANDPQGIYTGDRFLNSDFDYTRLRDNLQGKQILHLATHGQFVPGQANDSYLLLGTGEKLAIPDVAQLQRYLHNLHLVVLSACETALGGEGADGVEINGMSYYFLNQGAKTVLASLWQVNDASTSQLMQYFYRHLTEPNVTRANALRLAQLQLLYGEDWTPDPNQRNLLAVRPRNAPADAEDVGLAHPYYWSPFILIGNGF